MLQYQCNVYILCVVFFFFNKGPVGLPGEVGTAGSIGEKVIPIVILLHIKNSWLSSIFHMAFYVD